MSSWIHESGAYQETIIKRISLRILGRKDCAGNFKPILLDPYKQVTLPYRFGSEWLGLLGMSAIDLMWNDQNEAIGVRHHKGECAICDGELPEVFIDLFAWRCAPSIMDVDPCRYIADARKSHDQSLTVFQNLCKRIVTNKSSFTLASVNELMGNVSSAVAASIVKNATMAMQIARCAEAKMSSLRLACQKDGIHESELVLEWLLIGRDAPFCFLDCLHPDKRLSAEEYDHMIFILNNEWL